MGFLPVSLYRYHCWVVLVFEGIQMVTSTVIAGLVLGQSPLSVKRVKTLEGVRAVAISPSPLDSRFIVCLENSQVRIMDANGKIQSVSLVGHAQPAYGAAFSPDGKFVLTGDEQAKIFLWDAKTGKKLREFPREKGHQRGIQSLAYSADGKQFLSVGKDDSICVWNVSGGNPVVKITGEPANFYGAFFTKSGAVYTGTQAEGWRVLAPKTLATVTKVTLPGGQGANGFAMNRAGTLAVTLGRDGLVTVFDAVKRARLQGLKGHGDFVTAGMFTPSGRFVGTSSIDGTVRVWDAKAYKEVAMVDNRSYIGSPVAFTGDGKYLLTTNAFDTVEIHLLTPPQPEPKPVRRRR